MQELHDHFRQRWAGRERGGRRRFTPDAPFHAGWETRTPGERYFWDGLRRGGDPLHPQVILQVTLDGCGAYESAAAGGVQRLPAGRAFAAIIPSDHRYYLPADSPSWTFFWVMLRHPYMVARIAERQRVVPASAVLSVSADDLLVTRAVALFEGGFADRYAEEMALFALLVEYERHVDRSLAPPGAAEELLAEVRLLVRRNLARPLDVAELARSRGMSRSRYSHHFKEVTGASPARFVTEVRLEEVAQRLVGTEKTLAAIADETGFTDANHLCKVFRRHFHLSPGAFRRQMR